MDIHCKLPKEMKITGELYHCLRRDGYNCYMEVGLPSLYHPTGYMRVDVAVLDADDNPIAVVEVKKEGGKMGRYTRQAKAYRDLRRYGILPIFLSQFDDIPAVVSQIREAVAGRTEAKPCLTGIQ